MNTATEYTAEAAAAALGDQASLWHSGGGISIARVRLHPDEDGGPFVLVSEEDDGWLVGFYRDDEDEGSELLSRVARSATDLRDAVDYYRDAMRRGALLVFKHEDDADGEPIGPVRVEHEEWATHGVPRRYDPTRTERWVPLSRATDEAIALGIPLSES